MNIGSSAARETLEEIVHQFGLQITNESCADFRIHDCGGPSAEIDRGHAHGFVHRHEEIPSSQNATLGTKRLVERLSEHDSHIFDRVMLIYVKITARLQFEVETPVMCKQLQHVIEETNARRYLISPAPFDRQGNLDLRFLAVSLDRSLPHDFDAPCAIPSSSKVSCNAASNRSVSARGPSVIRTQPSQP